MLPQSPPDRGKPDERAYPAKASFQHLHAARYEALPGHNNSAVSSTSTVLAMRLAK